MWVHTNTSRPFTIMNYVLLLLLWAKTTAYLSFSIVNLIKKMKQNVITLPLHTKHNYSWEKGERNSVKLSDTGLSFSWIWMMWCVDLCWLRWLKWMWFDFSLKLSTQSFRLNSSLRSFISFSEMKKKLQSLHWEMKRSRRSRWWRRSWRRWTDTSQLFHTQSKTRRRWWKPMTSAF